MLVARLLIEASSSSKTGQPHPRGLDDNARKGRPCDCYWAMSDMAQGSVTKVILGITQSTNMLYTPYMVQKLSKLYNGL
jgi:hypothetical protein